MFSDLGAEKPVPAQKDDQRIAVEIKLYTGFAIRGVL
ncbi:MAG: hypothetical protein KGQ16_08135 [Cyanobacteria bacterium REEB444]|nr:hypothetical protein [Cyanobacteria bacterium REEB444]